ncbi:MAG: anthranilate phosphoribosyltransferase [Luminiphilus sp.]
MDIQTAIASVASGESLTVDAMNSVMLAVMQGEATEAQIGGLLVGLRMKGETIDEVVGAATAMRSLATPVNIDRTGLIDMCGTGGDGANLFNVSTAATFVVAAAGGRIAKHGNRSVSSSSGSSDVLAALGVNLDVTPDQIAQCIDEIGVGFMFAPAHHSAMKHAIGPRRELAMRTIFNILGPLTNPAGAKRQVLGVFDKSLCEPLAFALHELGSEHVMVVHGNDGLDELSVASTSHVCEMKDGELKTYEVDPTDFGLRVNSLSGLSVDNAEQSASLIRNALGGEKSETADGARAIIAMNAGAGLYVGGRADSLQAGIVLAAATIESGKALTCLGNFANKTQELAG